MQALLKLCKHRGFLFPTAEIYNNGMRGVFDYGPLGVELKRNIQNEWWKSCVHRRPDVVGMDSALLGPPALWKASGHLENFHDSLVDCRLSQDRFRVDHAPPIVSHSVTDGRYQIPITAKDKSQAKLWQSMIENQLAPGAEVTRSGERLTLICHGIAQPDGNTPGRLDLSATASIPYYGYVHPESNSPFLTPPRSFNLMFKTSMGPVEESNGGDAKTVARQWINDFQRQHSRLPTTEELLEWLEEGTNNDEQGANHQSVLYSSNTAFLRPETAQGVFVNYLNCQRSFGMRLPFGIAQTGKSFRNEIRPEYVIYRTAEFEQMELEWFCKPGDAGVWFDQWLDERAQWWRKYLNNPDSIRLREHTHDELAHYAAQCTDIEFKFPFGWGELEGIANRTDFDLKQHSEASGQSLEYLDDSDPKNLQRYYPYVVECSSGLSRACLAVLSDAYTEETRMSAKGEPTSRTVLKLHPKLAPIKVAVLPLLPRDPDLVKISEDIWMQCRRAGIFSRMDATGRSIGKRYARHDEIGTPFCVTVDKDTLEDGKVTLRNRDTAAQERIPLAEVSQSVIDMMK